jgi:hypothetical protein
VVSFLQDFSNKTLYAILSSSMCPTRPAQLILLDLLILTISGEDCKL